MESMTDNNPDTRPDAFGAMKALLTALANVPPKELMGAPTVLPRNVDGVIFRPEDERT